MIKNTEIKFLGFTVHRSPCIQFFLKPLYDFVYKLHTFLSILNVIELQNTCSTKKNINNNK